MQDWRGGCSVLMESPVFFSSLSSSLLVSYPFLTNIVRCFLSFSSNLLPHSISLLNFSHNSFLFSLSGRILMMSYILVHLFICSVSLAT